MKQTFFSIKALASLFLAATLMLASCSQNDSSDVVPAADSEADNSARKSSNDPNDQAFDKEMTRILREMRKMMDDMAMMDVMPMMDGMSMTGDPDMDFAMMMIKHHNLGIEVGNAELKYGKHSEAKEIARMANEGNARSAARLQSFLAQHPTPEKVGENVYKQYMKEMKTAMRTMNQSFRRVPNTPDVDVDFARKLTEHHEGAIDMANIILKYTNDKPIVDEGYIIITDQATELKELARFVNMHGIPNTTK